MMRVGVVGLGLIGGSFAKAYHAAGWEVLARNRSRSVLEFAKLSGEVNGELTEENIASCDLVLLTIYPEACINALRELAPFIGEKPVVIDCCGTKRVVCEACFPIAEEYDFTFVGGHPMAGTQYSGYKYAKATLYHNAPMVIVPPRFDDIYLLGRVKELLSPAGFSRFSVTTAEEHDRLIAFTSQLAHVVSGAYIKSSAAKNHMGFSAGSYRDMTRVERLNEDMWTELFMDNRENLSHEIDEIIEHLTEYKDAIEAGEEESLRSLLREGRERKAEIDKEYL